MIPKREILELRSEWQLNADVIEKDYVLGWLLAGISNESQLSSTWIFKGGTCLRKSYFETYRLSEDLDFTVVGEGPDEPQELAAIFARIAAWLQDAVGIELLVDDESFARRKNLRANATTQARIAYRGPNNQPTLPKIKLDITRDELVVGPTELRPIAHPYSDAPLPGEGVQCYSLAELSAEKIRALAQRCRPRDLYDVVHLSRHPDLLGKDRDVAGILYAKCNFVGIPVPDLSSIQASPHRDEIETEWVNMLGHQLPEPAAPFSSFWDALDGVFAWLDGELRVGELPRAELGNDLDSTWVTPRAMTSWNVRAPLELVRYAGSNRLKVEIDYRAQTGRQGPRLVEPYSLRRTRGGHLLLFVVNDHDLLRGYRVDRIAAVRPTDQHFEPRFLVEF